jgi:hypothetical protein
MTNDDRDLYEAFQASRAAERAGAPPFRRVLEGRAQGPGRRRGLVPGLLALGGAVAAIGLFAVYSHRSGNAEADLRLAQRVMGWRSSTDFLLPPTVSALLVSVPRIGEAPAGSPLRALDPGSSLGPATILRRRPRS